MLRTILLLGLISTVVHGGRLVTMTGQIVFEGGAPSSLPSRSGLIVKVKESSPMDASSKDLGTYSLSLYDYTPGTPLEFQFQVPVSDENNGYGFFSLSAVINVGWTPHRDEWIRKGDYLSDTAHDVIVEPGQTDVQQDITVVHYT